MMTLSGVRSSCDIVATNSDLSRRLSSSRRTVWSAIAACPASSTASAR